MEDLTEDKIFTMYRRALEADHSFPFTDFTQDHRDSYIRLKFRAAKGAKSQIDPANAMTASLESILPDQTKLDPFHSKIQLVTIMIAQCEDRLSTLERQSHPS